MNATRRIVFLAVAASCLVLGTARGGGRAAKVVPPIDSTQCPVVFTETIQVKKVGSVTIQPTHYVSFGPMSATPPAPMQAVPAGGYEVTDDDLGIFFSGNFVQEGAKLSLVVGGVPLVDWLYSRVEAVPGILVSNGLSFPTVTGKGKVYADGSGFRLKVKIRFTASVKYDLGQGEQQGEMAAMLSLKADTVP